MQLSGQIVSIPLPTLAGNSIKVAFGESAGGAYTPSPVTLEISINKCPGLVETDLTNRCNLSSSNGTYNSMTSLIKPYSIITNGTIANRYGICWAADGGQYYVNARWTYANCAFGAQVCGFAIQYNQGPY